MDPSMGGFRGKGSETSVLAKQIMAIRTRKLDQGNVTLFTPHLNRDEVEMSGKIRKVTFDRPFKRVKLKGNNLNQIRQLQRMSAKALSIKESTVSVTSDFDKITAHQRQQLESIKRAEIPETN